MHRLLLPIFLMFFSLSAQAGQAKEDGQNWGTTSAWVQELPEDEQVTVILHMRGALNTKINNDLAPHAKDNKDPWWPLKVMSYGNFMLSQLATRSPELGSQLLVSAKNVEKSIRGEMTVSDLMNGQKVSDQKIKNAFQATAIRKGQAVSTKYKLQLDRTETELIVYSMLAASH